MLIGEAADDMSDRGFGANKRFVPGEKNGT
jgi:hypothetical protein